ncbi:hypothetical protein [Rhodobium gokarnense]|uniref:Uncharacterized protein n=1 Tax=Rhodobium gokarnense TaxID=364296 RepID=A0ABT3HFP2_9HYPH|nr:hypothetical protein [Rhodobium gokarnense]MCW2309228.1 hypothetical protein [Rhodobium gokarnense]
MTERPAPAFLKPNRCASAVALAFGLTAAILLSPSAAAAGEADVVAAEASRDPSGTWTFRVTVRHADEGWDHYADKWQVLGPKGTVLATRTLHHPHVNEQPFTRSLSGVKLPAGIDSVTVRAGDSVHGFGGREFVVKLGP